MTQQPISGTLIQDLTLQCLDRQSRPVELVATFGYQPDDPYAVWLTFHAPDGEVRWAISRALMLHGLTAPAGEGDIRLWPSIDEDARAVLVIDFRSPHGRLVAQALTSEVHGFLTRSLAMVPLGTESMHLDVDALVASILGGSATE
ncbi:MAG: sporulation and cell division protein SsgA [Nocardioides sp.]|nr:sporulation and cell division protein SsgA [Nocardioides sp.]